MQIYYSFVQPSIVQIQHTTDNEETMDIYET